MRRLIAAIDTPDAAKAAVLVREVAPHCGLVKLGLEFFLRHGAPGYREVAQEQPVFLDLKLHDIPNTVAGAVRSLLPLAPQMLTIHAAGGGAMVAAAVEAAGAAPHRPKILAVTVLTSLDARALHEIGVAGGTTQQVLRLARLALENGADGLICSPHEIARLRDAFGEKPLLVVPGIRPVGAALGDQARVMTPEEAVMAGADYIVVGRPVTGAPDPGAAAAGIAAAIRGLRG
ncbi:orotidine-5'-phosphate decarboxylase [Acidocella sp.]|uniref:orotidine-5'-phosphate decarboxylase n=1 Tax=Acidocella sp. TaxID=50710 RepID=UPI002621E1BF|nr:orotidine-5'-phosphate decarboxylase [Acidocella sp.]MDD2795604.1 orotidine-5'-phosphate decarboxylase [Acidocella sp.]